MARAGSALLQAESYLIPVPLHWSRLFKRRYNQSAELARSLAKITSAQALPDGLIRVRQTPSQGGLSRLERRGNVRNAFRVSPRHRRKIANSHAIVIDDVMTTGATVEACAIALIDAGATRVDVLTLARAEQNAPLT